MPPRRKLRVGISACLLGRDVRYDGGHKRDDLLLRALDGLVDWVPVCPELEAGMGVPREPVRLLGPREAPRLVADRSGEDWTAPMRRFAEVRAAELARLDLAGYVTKSESPSCGMERVPVWSGRGRARRDGVGAFVRVLRERLPLLPIEEEGRLHDARALKRFVERMVAYGRLRRAGGADPSRARAPRRARGRLERRRGGPRRPRGRARRRRPLRSPPGLLTPASAG